MQEFKYKFPKSIKEASKLLNNNPSSNVLFAGGTDVLGRVKDKLISPSEIINLKSIDGLNNIEVTKKEFKIGALATISDLLNHPTIKDELKVLAEAAQSVASMQLRNIGTIGGNVCQRPRCWYFRGEFDCLRKGGDECFAATGENKYHAIIGGDSCYIVHPSDIAVALLALGASVTIFDGKKENTIPIEQFFVLPEEDIMSENILKSGEIVTKFVIPRQSISSKYIKIAERGVWDFAMVSVAGIRDKNSNHVRLAFGGVAPIPWIEKGLNNLLSNFSVDKISAAVDLAFKDAEPLEKNEYKVTLAKNITKKILQEI